MNDDAQQQYLEFQILNNQVKQINNQMGLLEQQLLELRSIEVSIEDLKGAKIGSKLLVPVGSGVFVEGELKNNKQVLMNIGAGIVVKKGFEETKELLFRQIMETENVMHQLESEARTIIGRIKELQGSFKEK